MKIKEVIAKTGLTDRAIRLYIENGLITPVNQKSYTGRNNFDFTHNDINKLEQIALLRKADFSLEQIKILQAGGKPAEDMLLEYLKGKEETVALEQRIVDVLKDLPTQEEVTIANICQRISKSLVKTPLPESDRKPTKAEQLEKSIMRIIAVFILVIWSLLCRGVFITYREDFPFPKFYTNPINFIGTAFILIPIVLSIVVLLLYRNNLFNFKKRKRRRWISGIALSIALIICIQPSGIAFLNIIPPIYSETVNPIDYLTLGTYTKMYENDIRRLFPAKIPGCAVAEDSKWYPPDKFSETTKYYYYFQDVFDPSFQIYAEWVLPENEFTEELNRIERYYPDGATHEAKWGDWVCMNFTDDTLNQDKAPKLDDYYYLIFAYNDKTNTVRYIASYSMDCGEDDKPYFLYLDWK